MEWEVILVAAAVLVHVLCAIQFSAIAQAKGHGSFFWWCLLCGIAG